MQHYYLNLAKDNSNLSLEQNINISYAIRRTAEDVFSNCTQKFRKQRN